MLKTAPKKHLASNMLQKCYKLLSVIVTTTIDMDINIKYNLHKKLLCFLIAIGGACVDDRKEQRSESCSSSVYARVAAKEPRKSSRGKSKVLGEEGPADAAPREKSVIRFLPCKTAQNRAM